MSQKPIGKDLKSIIMKKQNITANKQILLISNFKIIHAKRRIDYLASDILYPHIQITIHYKQHEKV